MKNFTVFKDASYEKYNFTESEFVEWYSNSSLRGLESLHDLIDNAKNPKYEYGYYIGLGYRVIYTQKSTPITAVSENNSCQHKNKYYNKISTALQFWVCPDCKKEI